MTRQELLLQVEGLSHSFPLGRTRFRRRWVQAVLDVSLQLAAGRTLGIVGESGSGKSTLARCISYLHSPQAGTVRFRGQDLRELEPAALRAVRRDLAMVFQNPYTSLDPTWSVEQIVAEPLVVQRIGDGDSRRTAVASVLERVGLDPQVMDRRPAAFSGGQRQRIAIARALVTDPALVICDEAVSALDVSTRAQVLRLLADLQEDRQLAYLFITHDLTVARAVSDDIAVMFGGRIVEMGPANGVLERPQHPYTRALLDAAPRIRLHERPAPSAPLAEVDVNSATSGCAYAARCPERTPVCSNDPPLERFASDWAVACHHKTTTGQVEPVSAGRGI